MNIRIASMLRAAKDLERRADHYWFLSNAPKGAPYRRRFQAARLAARVLQAQGNAHMDWLCRLATLEGAAHTSVQPRKWVMRFGNALPGRGASAEAENTIRAKLGGDVDPEWFSPKDTGMYRVARARLIRGLESYDIPDDPDDAMQMAIFGLSTSGELKLSQFWSGGKRLESGIKSGKESPKEVAQGPAGTFIIKQFVLNRLETQKSQQDPLDRTLSKTPMEVEGPGGQEVGPSKKLQAPTPEFTDDVYYVMFQAMQKSGDQLGAKLREWVRSIWKADGGKVSEAREKVMDVWFSMWLKSGRKPSDRAVAEAVGVKSHVTIKNYVDEFDKKWKRMNLFEMEPKLGEEVIKRWRKTTATPPRKRQAFGRANTVKVKWEEGGGGSVGNKQYPRIADAVDAVEKLFKRAPKTIVMGPKFSIGPNTPADPYSEPPFVLSNHRGDTVEMAYSSLELLDKHWPKVFGWGRQASQDRRGQILRRQILRLAKTLPEHKATFLSLLRAPTVHKQGCGCGGGGDEVMGCGGGDEVMGCGDGGDGQLACGDEMMGAEYDPIYARHEKGVKTDPTKDMSPEDAKKWKDNTEKHRDKFKRKEMLACGDDMFAMFEEGVDADPTENMSPEDAKRWRDNTERHRDKFKQAQNVLYRWACEAEQGEMLACGDEVFAEMEIYSQKQPGDDPTEDMSPEDAKKWHAMNQKHRDKFKQANDTVDTLAMFEEGKPADPTKNMSPADRKKWWTEHKKNKNKFTQKGAGISLIELPLGTRAKNMLFFGKAPWLETRPVLALKAEFNREDGMASPGTVARAVKSLQGLMAPNKRAASALQKIIRELSDVGSGHGMRLAAGDRAPSRGGDLFVRIADNVLDPDDWSVSVISFELPPGATPVPGASYSHIQLGKVSSQRQYNRGSYRLPEMKGWDLKKIQDWVTSAPGDEVHPAEYHEWALPNGTWSGEGIMNKLRGKAAAGKLAQRFLQQRRAQP